MSSISGDTPAIAANTAANSDHDGGNHGGAEGTREQNSAMPDETFFSTTRPGTALTEFLLNNPVTKAQILDIFPGSNEPLIRAALVETPALTLRIFKEALDHVEGPWDLERKLYENLKRFCHGAGDTFSYCMWQKAAASQQSAERSVFDLLAPARFFGFLEQISSNITYHPDETTDFIFRVFSRVPLGEDDPQLVCLFNELLQMRMRWGDKESEALGSKFLRVLESRQGDTSLEFISKAAVACSKDAANAHYLLDCTLHFSRRQRTDQQLHEYIKLLSSFGPQFAEKHPEAFRRFTNVIAADDKRLKNAKAFLDVTIPFFGTRAIGEHLDFLAHGFMRFNGAELGNAGAVIRRANALMLAGTQLKNTALDHLLTILIVEPANPAKRHRCTNIRKFWGRWQEMLEAKHAPVFKRGRSSFQVKEVPVGDVMYLKPGENLPGLANLRSLFHLPYRDNFESNYLALPERFRTKEYTNESEYPKKIVGCMIAAAKDESVSREEFARIVKIARPYLARFVGRQLPPLSPTASDMDKYRYIDVILGLIDDEITLRLINEGVSTARKEDFKKFAGIERVQFLLSRFSRKAPTDFCEIEIPVAYNQLHAMHDLISDSCRVFEHQGFQAIPIIRKTNHGHIVRREIIGCCFLMKARIQDRDSLLWLGGGPTAEHAQQLDLPSFAKQLVVRLKRLSSTNGTEGRLFAATLDRESYAKAVARKADLLQRHGGRLAQSELFAKALSVHLRGRIDLDPAEYIDAPRDYYNGPVKSVFALAATDGETISRAKTVIR